MRLHFGHWILLLLACFPAITHAQVINGYAQVTSISGNVLTIGSSNETASTFNAGGYLVVMQMQDNVIGANTANTASFGNLSSIQNAGAYVVRMIASVTRSGSALTTVTISGTLGMTFNTGANASVQIITLEMRGGGSNYTTTANMAAHPWNGSYGGVLALQVNGTLTLAHSITADGAGFRGGARDAYSYTSPCNTTDFVWSSTAAGTEYFATKGEGAYKLSTTALADGRGKIINGGGGANQINAGGGGGGNFTAGGSAGLGWSCTADAGGIGGLGLGSYISGSRIFLGGGGGGGEGNDNVSTDGANGGGIILIQAQAIRTTGTLSGLRISANGGSAGTSGNDGAGGAGAGGSIVLNVPTYTVASTAPLTIEANGGVGGTVNTSTHGGGAGGGQGAVIYSIARPTTNITTRTQNGLGGCNETPCITRAGSGGGSNDAGILSSHHTPLPIELLAFNAEPEAKRVLLHWATASETENERFTIERSVDGTAWEVIGTLPGAGTSLSTIHYNTNDEAPLPGLSFYRLRQTDLSGAETWSNAVAVNFAARTNTFHLFPNPAHMQVVLAYDMDLGTGRAVVTDGAGRAVREVRTSTGRTDLDLSGLPPGAYLVSLFTERAVHTERLLIAK